MKAAHINYYRNADWRSVAPRYFAERYRSLANVWAGGCHHVRNLIHEGNNFIHIDRVIDDII